MTSTWDEHAVEKSLNLTYECCGKGGIVPHFQCCGKSQRANVGFVWLGDHCYDPHMAIHHIWWIVIQGVDLPLYDQKDSVVLYSTKNWVQECSCV